MAGRMPFSSSMPEMFDPYAAIRPAYMRRPVERPAAYYFLRTILIAGGIAGSLVALYRNDVLLELSRRVGQESRYFQLEQYLGMSPGWGTPRSMQEVLESQSATPGQPVGLAAPVLGERPVAVPALANDESEPPTGTTPVAAAIAPATVASPAVGASKAGLDPLAPVSLDSLPVLPRGGHAPAVAEAAPLTTPERSPSVSRLATTGGKSRAAAAVADSEPDAEPAPTRSRKARNVEPEPDAAPVAKARKPTPEPERPKTAPNPHDNPLTASIRAAVRARPSKN
jgi:hypothetical protein